MKWGWKPYIKQRIQNQRKQRHDKNIRSKKFTIGDLVLLIDSRF